VPALIGQSLLEVAKNKGIDIEGPCSGGGGPTEVRRTDEWVEYTYGEGESVLFSFSFNLILNFNMLPYEA
jgi:hypothetical protein